MCYRVVCGVLAMTMKARSSLFQIVSSEIAAVAALRLMKWRVGSNPVELKLGCRPRCLCPRAVVAILQANVQTTVSLTDFQASETAALVSSETCEGVGGVK